MRPYYQDESVTIYHGDCREVLPTLDKVDLVLTDPPYGISIVKGLGSTNGTKPFGTGNIGGAHAVPPRVYIPVHGDDTAFDPRFLIKLAPHVIIWGANYFAHLLPPSSRWLIWDKREGGTPDNFADCELAWSNINGPARIFSRYWRGMLSKYEIGEERVHPTQKPVGLMRWCMDFKDDASLILDPFMGSGTTLRAAKDLGRKAIGIEIEERYCEIAAKRMAQMAMDLQS